jgi:branched-chain amino acid transport system permease protein
MELFIAQIVNGLSLGSLYVLFVTGFNLLLLVAAVIHFTYPQVVILSMYVGWFAMSLTGGNLILGAAAAVASSVIVSVATAPLFRMAAGRRGEADINASMVMSLAIGLVVTEAMTHGFNQGRPVSISIGPAAGMTVFRTGLVTLTASQLASLLGGAVAVGGLFILLGRTRMGRAFRAVAEDAQAARQAGIPLFRTSLQSHALAGLLGGITACLLAAILGYASADLGLQVTQKVLAVSIIAGLGNLVGGLVVGLALGILEAVVQGYVSGTWSDAIAFCVMLVVILARPRGLFGSKL